MKKYHLVLIVILAINLIPLIMGIGQFEGRYHSDKTLQNNNHFIAVDDENVMRREFEVLISDNLRDRIKCPETTVAIIIIEIIWSYLALGHGNLASSLF